jgi:hypothetical protein
VPVDDQELRKLLRHRQAYFVPYYLEVVNRHPEGVLAKDVKDQVARLLLSQFGIDIYEPGQSGLNPSTKKSRADQWVNNLVSNHVLDDHMLVVRSHRAILYPGGYDNSQPLLPTGPPLEASEVDELNNRDPKKVPPSSSASTPFQRSLQLAEFVRVENDYLCAVSQTSCSAFLARDGHSYVEVHHIIPMAQQSGSAINLDRVTNMTPLCPGCHTCLHRGGAADAGKVLGAVLAWFEIKHGQPFADANSDLTLGTTPGAVLTMYGLS